MVLDMIKPFTIQSTRVEPDGTLGVLYKVQLREQVSPTIVRTKTLEAYVNLPKGEDVEVALFNYLNDAGWIQ